MPNSRCGWRVTDHGDGVPRACTVTEKAAEADAQMQRNFDEDGNRIPDESAVPVI